MADLLRVCPRGVVFNDWSIDEECFSVATMAACEDGVASRACLLKRADVGLPQLQVAEEAAR